MFWSLSIFGLSSYIWSERGKGVLFYLCSKGALFFVLFRKVIFRSLSPFIFTVMCLLLLEPLSIPHPDMNGVQFGWLDRCHITLIDELLLKYDFFRIVPKFCLSVINYSIKHTVYDYLATVEEQILRSRWLPSCIFIGLYC